MRRLAFLTALALIVPATAHADRYDFRLYQLGAPSSDPAANKRFSAFMQELGVAITNWNLEPPETTGFAGFNFAFEYPVSLVNDSGTLNGIRYWPIDPAYTGTGALQMPGVHVRKGLPFSLELGVKANYIEGSNMVATTIEAKWALNEGFLYFPDLGARGWGTQLIGAREFTLTVAGFDLGLGKQIPINGMCTITPYVGWASVWVAASSNVVDFSPGQSETDQFHAPNNASGTATQDVFNSVDIGTNRHNRFYGGIRFIGYVLELGLEGSWAQVNTDVTSYTVATYSAKVGLDF